LDVFKVNSPHTWKKFVYFPQSIYRDDPLWIAPLWSEQKKMFSPRHLQQYQYDLFLVGENRQPAGRAAVFIDANYNEYWKEKTGFFGSYECLNDSHASKKLLSACEDWLRQRSMDRMRGPISFESQNWGVICEGFGQQPRIMSPYNPPYYNDLFLDAGLNKVKDLEVFAAETEHYQIPERYTRHAELLRKKYRLTIRHADMKHLVDEVRTIVDLSNRSLYRNWGYAPISMNEAEGIARDLKMIVRPELVLIVESGGSPIGFSIALPDIYQVLKGLNGRLFPLGIFKILTGMSKINEYRMWALGIVPEYHRKGIDTLLYLETFKIFRHKKIRMEANYILEDNYAMKDAVVKLGMKKARAYRIYEKRIA